MASFKEKKHLPNAIMQAIYQELEALRSSGRLTGKQMLFMNPELQSFADNMGACERIQKTPIPYAYSLFLKKVIFLYIFTMPIGFVSQVGTGQLVSYPLVFYTFAGIEVIAKEIETPLDKMPTTCR